MFNQLSQKLYFILILLNLDCIAVYGQDCSMANQQTCSLGGSVWCCPKCSTKVSYCTLKPPPTFPSIVTFHFTRPDYWDIKPLPSGDPISPALQVVLGLVVGSVVCCPLIIVAVLTCCACIQDFYTKRQQNLDQRQLRKQAKLGVPTSSNEKPSLSTISSALEALPPPYDGVSDKHHVEAAPPSYNIALIHLQSSDTIISIKDTDC
ncbi:unnamed protein product [Adineta ricciae]|uniref:Uncharacterized protein n=1 Tax=Adineta ricciae TaxID=249248 RepID=A0A815DC27_ADIRI|nr:unnamed protein product [Adineta ricciae]